MAALALPIIWQLRKQEVFCGAACRRLILVALAGNWLCNACGPGEEAPDERAAGNFPK